LGRLAPSAKLDVNAGEGSAGFNKGINILTGNATYTTGHGGILQFQNEDVITAGIRGVRDPGSWASSLLFYTHTSASGNTFGTTFTEKMRITDGGNVGIGTTNPTEKLYVDGNANITGWVNASNYIATPLFYNSGDHRTLNKAGTGWITWAGRDTSGSETVINLASIGSFNSSGAVTLSNYGAGFLKTDANGLVSVDTSTYLTSVAFSDLTSTPTTIAGYGITDALEIGTTATTALAGDTAIPVSGTDFDPVGTDNSTNVTLVTTSHDYLSLSGQAITLGAINLDDINGGATAGILQTDASGVVSVDTSTYLTSYTETDTLQSVTTRGSSTSTVLSTNGGNIVLRADSIENHVTDGNAAIVFNYYGYASGHTQFRDTIFYNGKGSAVMFVDGSSSNVLIGTTADSGYKLDVSGTGRFSGDLLVKNTTTHAYLNIDAAALSAAEAGVMLRVGGTDKWEIYTANNDGNLSFWSAGQGIKFKIEPTGAATFSSSVTATTFLGDLNGTINTLTTGTTQTAGNN
jgi:hypothetical protein